MYHFIRAFEFVFVALGISEMVRHRVEGEPAGKRHRRHQLGRGKEVVRVRVAVVSRGEVAIERSENAVLLPFRIASLPLANARPACIRKYKACSTVRS